MGARMLNSFRVKVCFNAIWNSKATRKNTKLFSVRKTKD